VDLSAQGGTDGRTEAPSAPEVPYASVYSQSVIVLDAPARMMTMNWARGTANRWQVAEVTQLWRFCAKVRALELHVPRYTWVRVRATPFVAKGVLADVGGHYPVIKACLDGILLDAGVLEDDSPSYVHAITMEAPQRGPAGVKIELRGPLASFAPPSAP